MAGVKSRLKLFEPNSEGDDMASVPGAKGGIAVLPITKNVSPALQRFLQNQTEVLEGKKSTEKTTPEVQSKPPGVPRVAPKISPVKTEQDENKNSVTKRPDLLRKTSTDSVSSNSSEAKVAFKPSDNRRVSVPKAFQQDSASSSNSSKKSNYPTHAIKPNFVPKPAVSKPAVNTKPVTPFKPPVKPSSSSTDSAPADKSSFANKQNQSNTASSNDVELKKADANKKPVSVTNSTASSASSSSSASSHEPSSASGEKGVFDFRSQLRKTKTHSPAAIEIQSAATSPKIESSAPENKLTSPKSPLTNGSPISPTAVKSIPSNDSDVPLDLNSKKDTPELKRQSSIDIQERKSDKKKFKKIKLNSFPNSAPAPVKPPLPYDVDLTQIQQQYQRAIKNLKAGSDASNADDPEVDEVDAIYDEGYSIREVQTRESTAKRESERVSLIPDMSAEEEGMDGPLYDEGFTPGSEIYVDAETEKKAEEDDMYEEESFLKQETEEEKKKRLKEEAEAKKKEENERKKEERKRKKEEKEKAQKEKDEIKLKKKFNITDDTNVGEGVIKQDARAWKLGLDLSVKQGQIVTIVRLDNNPVNKWLVKSENGMGYVDSNNIEVEPAIIKQIMVRSLLNESCDLEKSLSLLATRDFVSNAMDKGRKNSTTPAVEDDDDQPVYDDVPEDTVAEESEEFEEIYEEV